MLTTRVAAFAAVALLASVANAAASQTITVQADQFCDVFQITVDNGIVAGADIGCGYTNAIGAGTGLYLNNTIQPTGKVFTIAGQFNTEGYINQVYINLTNMTVVFYDSNDGAPYAVNSSPITFMRTKTPSHSSQA